MKSAKKKRPEANSDKPEEARNLPPDTPPETLRALLYTFESVGCVHEALADLYTNLPRVLGPDDRMSRPSLPDTTTPILASTVLVFAATSYYASIHSSVHAPQTSAKFLWPLLGAFVSASVLGRHLLTKPRPGPPLAGLIQARGELLAMPYLSTEASEAVVRVIEEDRSPALARAYNAAVRSYDALPTAEAAGMSATVAAIKLRDALDAYQAKCSAPNANATSLDAAKIQLQTQLTKTEAQLNASRQRILDSIVRLEKGTNSETGAAAAGISPLLLRRPYWTNARDSVRSVWVTPDATCFDERGLEAFTAREVVGGRDPRVVRTRIQSLNAILMAVQLLLAKAQGARRATAEALPKVVEEARKTWATEAELPSAIMQGNENHLEGPLGQKERNAAAALGAKWLSLVLDDFRYIETTAETGEMVRLSVSSVPGLRRGASLGGAPAPLPDACDALPRALLPPALQQKEAVGAVVLAVESTVLSRESGAAANAMAIDATVAGDKAIVSWEEELRSASGAAAGPRMPSAVVQNADGTPAKLWSASVLPKQKLWPGVLGKKVREQWPSHPHPPDLTPSLLSVSTTELQGPLSRLLSGAKQADPGELLERCVQAVHRGEGADASFQCHACGGAAIFLGARTFLDHVERTHFRGPRTVSLAAAAASLLDKERSSWVAACGEHLIAAAAPGAAAASEASLRAVVQGIMDGVVGPCAAPLTCGGCKRRVVGAFYQTRTWRPDVLDSGEGIRCAICFHQTRKAFEAGGRAAASDLEQERVDQFALQDLGLRLDLATNWSLSTKEALTNPGATGGRAPAAFTFFDALRKAKGRGAGGAPDCPPLTPVREARMRLTAAIEPLAAELASPAPSRASVQENGRTVAERAGTLLKACCDFHAKSPAGAVPFGADEAASTAAILRAFLKTFADREALRVEALRTQQRSLPRGKGGATLSPVDPALHIAAFEAVGDVAVALAYFEALALPDPNTKASSKGEHALARAAAVRLVFQRSPSPVLVDASSLDALARELKVLDAAADAWKNSQGGALLQDVLETAGAPTGLTLQLKPQFRDLLQTAARRARGKQGPPLAHEGVMRWLADDQQPVLEALLQDVQAQARATAGMATSTARLLSELALLMDAARAAGLDAPHWRFGAESLARLEKFAQESNRPQLLAELLVDGRRFDSCLAEVLGVSGAGSEDAKRPSRQGLLHSKNPLGELFRDEAALQAFQSQALELAAAHVQRSAVRVLQTIEGGLRGAEESLAGVSDLADKLHDATRVRVLLGELQPGNVDPAAKVKAKVLQLGEWEAQAVRIGVANCSVAGAHIAQRPPVSAPKLLVEYGNLRTTIERKLLHAVQALLALSYAGTPLLTAYKTVLLNRLETGPNETVLAAIGLQATPPKKKPFLALDSDEEDEEEQPAAAATTVDLSALWVRPTSSEAVNPDTEHPREPEPSDDAPRAVEAANEVEAAKAPATAAENEPPAAPTQEASLRPRLGSSGSENLQDSPTATAAAATAAGNEDEESLAWMVHAARGARGGQASAAPPPAPVARERAKSGVSTPPPSDPEGSQTVRAAAVGATKRRPSPVPCFREFQPTTIHRLDPGVVVLGFEGLWRCTCGEINRLAGSMCAACGADLAPCRKWVHGARGVGCTLRSCRYVHATIRLNPELTALALDAMGSLRRSISESALQARRRTKAALRPPPLPPRDRKEAVGVARVVPAIPVPVSTPVTPTAAVAMRNEEGEYNCFLNVLIQSLWHLRDFRTVMLSPAGAPPPGHEEEAAVLQALRQIFASIDRKEKAQGRVESKEEGEALLAPTDLRDALSARFRSVGLFQEGEMNDASEALQSILDCLDRAEGERPDSWVRRLFALRLRTSMDCIACSLHNPVLDHAWAQLNEFVQAFQVREKGMVAVLRADRESDMRSCDADVGGCGTFTQVIHSLELPLPRLFTVTVSWDSPNPSSEEVTATVRGVPVRFKLGDVYRVRAGDSGEDEAEYALQSMTTYYGAHYMAFAREDGRGAGQWTYFDDKISRPVGGWERVVERCTKGKLQPTILIYERV